MQRERERERETYRKLLFTFPSRYFGKGDVISNLWNPEFFFQVWTKHVSCQVTPHNTASLCCSDYLSRACAWSPRFPSLGLPVQKFHCKMTSSVLKIPVQWNVTLLEITVQVKGTFGIVQWT